MKRKEGHESLDRIRLSPDRAPEHSEWDEVDHFDVALLVDQAFVVHPEQDMSSNLWIILDDKDDLSH